MLTGKNIKLRYLQPNDLDFISAVENDERLWKFGSERTHFTKEDLINYISNAQQDIAIAGQFRFVIDLNGVAIGMIDLFDYTGSEAEVGVLVIKEYQHKGYAKEALSLLINYAFNKLRLKTLKCSIAAKNKISIALFTSSGFKLIEKNKLNYYLLSNE